MCVNYRAFLFLFSRFFVPKNLAPNLDILLVWVQFSLIHQFRRQGNGLTLIWPTLQPTDQPTESDRKIPQESSIGRGNQYCRGSRWWFNCLFHQFCCHFFLKISPWGEKSLRTFNSLYLAPQLCRAPLTLEGKYIVHLQIIRRLLTSIFLFLLDLLELSLLCVKMILLNYLTPCLLWPHFLMALKYKLIFFIFKYSLYNDWNLHK